MFARHNRVWLSKDGWARAADVHSTHAHILMQWAENDWPVIVRRRDVDMPLSMVALGIPLPPDITSKKKGRIAFTAHRDQIRCNEGALNVHDIQTALPSRWQHIHARLCKQAVSTQLEFRVYGSLAMQALTGLPYLTDQSDIDLLLAPRSRAELTNGLAMLSKYVQLLPLDGEIVFPSGRAVAWKEWLQVDDAGQNIYVLTKSMEAVALVRAEELLDELPDELSTALPDEWKTK